MAYRHVVRNPRLQSRIFLSNWFLKVVRPGRQLPPNVVQFHVPLDMSKFDVKNYLKAIYDIPVVRVHTRIQQGKRRDIVEKGRQIKKKFPDYKVAYVYLGAGQTFKFPDLFMPQEKGSVKDEESGVQDSIETVAHEQEHTEQRKDEVKKMDLDEEEQADVRWF